MCTVSVLLGCDTNANSFSRVRVIPFSPHPIASIQVGVSRDPQTFLKHGDIVTCSIETVGSITNPVQGQHVHTDECDSNCDG